MPSTPDFVVVDQSCYHDIEICRSAAKGMLKGTNTLKDWQRIMSHERNECALKPMNAFWYIDMKFLHENALPLMVQKLHTRVKDLYLTPTLLPTLATTLSFSQTPYFNAGTLLKIVC